MAEQLKNTLSFVNLAPGATVVLPHGLNTGSTGPRPIAPDVIFIPSPDLEVAGSDALNVTLTNQGSTPFSGSILVEAWHTVERAFNGQQNVDLPIKPYVVVSVENNGQPLQPAFPSPPVTVIIYVRTDGNDLTGKGTLAKPYATEERAGRDIPNPIPPGFFYRINTNVSEALVPDFILPAWKSAMTILGDFSQRFWHIFCGVTIESVDPILVPVVPASDSTINFGDAVATTDPKSGLVSIKLNVPRATWTNANYKGKHSQGAAAGFESSVIMDVTGNDTILLSTFIVPTFPVELMQEVVTYTTTSSTGQLAGLNAINCDSIAFHGVKILNGQSLLLSVLTDGVGLTSFEFCTLENPGLQSTGSFQSKVINTRIFGDLVVVGQATNTCTFTFFDTCTGGVFAVCDSVATLPVFQSCGFFGCDPVEPRNFVAVPGIEFAKPVQSFSMLNCLFRDSVGDALVYHGSSGVLDTVDFQNSGGNDITVSKGAIGVLELNNVHSSVPSIVPGTFGLRVEDGQIVKPDALTYQSATPLKGAAGEISCGNLAPRTWLGYELGGDGRPPLLELDLTALQLLAGDFSNAAAAPAFIVGTGSKIFS